MPGILPALALMLAPATFDPPAEVPHPEIEEIEDGEVLAGTEDSEQRMTIPVSIGEQGPFPFLIDTGSQRTVLSSVLAERLNLQQGPEVRIVSVGGTDTVRTAELDQVQLGRRTIPLATVPILQRRHMGADGIVGTDSLQGQRVLLDFKQNQIEIGNAQSLGGDRGYEIVVRARRRSGQLVMTNAVIDGVRTSVIVDTGAGTSVGNRALQRALQKRGGPGALVTLMSVTGHSITADLGFAEKLAIRDIGITNLVIAFTDTPAFTALGLDKRPALFLGMRELRLFNRVAIDFGKRKVMFDLPSLE